MLHEGDAIEVGDASEIQIAVHTTILSCPHEYITTDGVCAGCGTTYAGWSCKGKIFHSKGPNHIITKINDRSILPDLAKYNFTEDIKHEANNIFLRIGRPTKRGKERDKMLFFLVYTAYREKQKFVNPQSLGKEMGLAPGDVNKALTTFSEAQTGYRPRIKRATLLDAIPKLCEELEHEEWIPELLEIGKDVLKKNRNLNEEFPQKVAAGIISYFMEFNGIKLPPEQLKEKVNLSDVTIKEIHQRITRIHNE